MVYMDDNFGVYDIQDEEDIFFYRMMQESNVEKYCGGCGNLVKIQPQYAYCNSCADRIERGADIGMQYDPETGEAW